MLTKKKVTLGKEIAEAIKDVEEVYGILVDNNKRFFVFLENES